MIRKVSARFPLPWTASGLWVLLAALAVSCSDDSKRPDTYGDADSDSDVDSDSDGDTDVDSDSDGDTDSDTDADGDCPGYCRTSADCREQPCDPECVCDAAMLRPDYVAAFSDCVEGADCGALADAFRKCAGEIIPGIEPSETAAQVGADCEARTAECELECSIVAIYTDEAFADFARCFDEPTCDDVYACLDPLDTLCD